MSAVVTCRETVWRSWARAFLDCLNGGHRTDSRAGLQAGFDFQCGCFWATENRAPNKNVCPPAAASDTQARKCYKGQSGFTVR